MILQNDKSPRSDGFVDLSGDQDDSYEELSDFSELKKEDFDEFHNERELLDFKAQHLKYLYQDE